MEHAVEIIGESFSGNSVHENILRRNNEVENMFFEMAVYELLSILIKNDDASSQTRCDFLIIVILF